MTMRADQFKPLLFVAMLLADGVLAGEQVIASDVLGAEAPLVVDGKVYYVGWVSHTLSRWDGNRSIVLHQQAGCGHNGLALTARKTLLLACSEKGAILELDLDGKELRRWDADSKGTPFTGGINDIVVTANGGAYATVFGAFVERPTLVIGKVVYLAPGAAQWVEMANDLNYANGIGISPDQKTLYVAETAGNSIKSFSVNADGTLRDRYNFAQLNVLVPNKTESWWIGPDSLKVDAQGNLYVAQWMGGKVLKISSAGALLRVFEIAAGDGTTNVAFGEDGKHLYVSVVKDPADPQARGSIVRVDNVE
jgi:gluconolactonase